MGTSFSPTALAARRFAAGEASRPPFPANPPAAPAVPAGAVCELSCEWPRVQSLPPFRGIRQALRQIQAMQARHA
jgi:hypothetical protein